MAARQFDRLIEGENTFGLDISSTRVKAMWVDSKRRGLKLRSFGEESFPASAVVGGIVRRPEIVSAAITKVLKNAVPRPIETPYAICSIPQERVFIKIESFPRLEYEKLEQAVKYRVKSVLAMPLDRIYWDWFEFPSETDEENVNILFAAIEREVIDSYIQAINQAGVIPLAFEIEADAVARVTLVDKKYANENPKLFVDIGNSNSVLAIYHKGSLRFNSSVNIGGNQLTKIISTIKKISLSEARTYKINTGFKSKSAELIASIKGALSPLVQEINSSIAFYDKTLEKTDDINDILLYGDGANLLNIDEYLDDELKKQNLRYANPRVQIVPIPQFVSHKKIYPHLVVTGLALRGKNIYKDVQNDINFLPETAQKTYSNDQLQKKIGKAGRIFVVNIIALIGFLFGGSFLLDETSKEIDATINVKKAVLEGSRVREISQEISDFNSIINATTSIINSDISWIKFFDELIFAVPNNVVVEDLDIFLDEATSPSQEPRWLISIFGSTDNRQTVIDFSDALLNSDIFEDVTIPVSTFSSANVVEFQVNAEVKYSTLLKYPEQFKKVETTTELELRPIEIQ